MKFRLAALVAHLLVSPAAAGDSLPPMIDAHAHYTLPDSRVFTPDALVTKMDAAGVTRLVVTSQPPALAQTLYRHAPTRILPLLGIYDHGFGKARWVHDATLPARVEAALDEGHWVGLGELHLFAADVQQPVFETLVKLAAERNLVLLLHGDPEIVLHAYSIAPGVRILWAHLGTDPRPETLEPLLAQYPQLWIDTSVRDERIAPDGQLRPEWRVLFERHPTRFVVAVDTFSTHRWQHYGEVVDAIRHWAGSLPPELQRRLLHDNAAQLFDTFPAAPGRP